MALGSLRIKPSRPSAAKPLNLYVNFLTDNLNSYSSGNAYCLRINTSYAYLYRYKLKNGAGNGRNVGSNVRINLNTLGNHARFSIRVDRKKNSIALFVNEKFIKHWIQGADVYNHEL